MSDSPKSLILVLSYLVAVVGTDGRGRIVVASGGTTHKNASFIQYLFINQSVSPFRTVNPVSQSVSLFRTVSRSVSPFRTVNPSVRPVRAPKSDAESCLGGATVKRPSALIF